MKCPKDSTETIEKDMCLETLNGYECTRKKGHKEDHHAHGGDICCEQWRK